MKAALLFLALSTAAFAQPNTCVGFTSVKDGAKPVYPPIAKAAHVEGDVVLLVSFKTTGEADDVTVVSGPPMLRQAATDYLKSWKANEYSGARSCQVTITYKTPDNFCSSSEPGFVKRTDPQHVIVQGGGGICQPLPGIKSKDQ
jgi:TonB family protein